jgi:putative endonuclease
MYCYVYIVQCSNNGLYTGITKNLRRRIRQHNGITKGGAYYTRMHRPVFFVHIERYPTRKAERQRELEIQSWNHDEKLELIEKTTKRQIIASI